MNIYFAPLQGYTDDAYRRLHHELCGGVTAYFTPFVRLIHGELRSKERRDIRREFNEGVPLIPQIMASTADEMHRLCDAVLAEGHRAVNLNMGCPFPLQTRHGNGAGILPHPDRVAELCRTMEDYEGVEFSVKMRLGLDDAEEWRALMPMLNAAPLAHVTLHPRIGADQYKGEPRMEAFAAFAAECSHPLIYNGDVTSLDDVQRLGAMCPSLHGVMIGRGLLARPTLAAEIAAGRMLDDDAAVRTMRLLHDRLLAHYEQVVPGEAAQLNKIRSFWDYAEPTIGRKAWKKLKKAGNKRNYLLCLP